MKPRAEGFFAGLRAGREAVPTSTKDLFELLTLEQLLLGSKRDDVGWSFGCARELRRRRREAARREAGRATRGPRR